MANTDNPTGLRALYALSGGPILMNLYKKVVGYGTAIFPGDAVNRVADGSIEAGATPGTTLYTGVAQNHGAASTATEHLVVDDPNVVFVAQGDDGTNLDEADMGLNANLILGAGSTTTKQSKHEIDSSTKNTTNTLDVKLLRKLDVPDNAYGEFAKIEILFNRHRLHAGVAGV